VNFWFVADLRGTPPGSWRRPVSWRTDSGDGRGHAAVHGAAVLRLPEALSL